MKKMKLSDVEDYETIMGDDPRCAGTPTIYDLDEILDLLSKHHKVDSFFIKRNLKWVFKHAYKDLNLVCKNPYWMPKAHQR